MGVSNHFYTFFLVIIIHHSLTHIFYRQYQYLIIQMRDITISPKFAI